MRKEIEALNKAPKDKAAIDGLRQIIGQHACLVLGSNGKIDPSKTDACFEFLQALGAPKAPSGKYASAVTLDEFLGAKKKALRCDPSADGVALDPDGVSQDDAAIEWGGVPDERHVLVLLARRKGAVAGRPDPDTRRSWAEQLSKPVLAGVWAKMQRIWDGTGPGEKPLKESDKEALREALIYQRQDSTVRVPVDVPPPPPPAPSVSVKIGGSVGSTSVSGNGNVVSQGSVVGKATRTFHILSADPGMEQEFRRHAFTAIKTGIFGLTSSANVPPGANATETRRSLIASSAAVLVLVTSSTLADQEISDTIDALVTQGKPIIPVLCRSALMPAALAQMTVVPRNGTPIANWGDRDSAWAEVVDELRKVALR